MMTDEKFAFYQDIKEKKAIAQNARFKGNRTGSGGVKLPHDNLSRKELEAMNGETKSYKLNSPMRWKEFKAMPDDIKILYIKALQQKFAVPYKCIAEMFGVNNAPLSREVARLGISKGRGGKSKNWDKEGWTNWLKGGTQAEPVIEQNAAKNIDQTESTNAVLHSGCMTFDGTAEATLKTALRTLSQLMGGASVRITVSWEVAEGCANHNG